MLVGARLVDPLQQARESVLITASDRRNTRLKRTPERGGYSSLVRQIIYQNYTSFHWLIARWLVA